MWWVAVWVLALDLCGCYSKPATQGPRSGVCLQYVSVAKATAGMPKMSREAFVRFALVSWARTHKSILPSDIDALVAAAKTPNYGRDANMINSTIDFEHRGEAYSLQAEVVWDAQRRRWLTLFDGHGPNDELLEETPDGTYRIDWGDAQAPAGLSP